MIVEVDNVLLDRRPYRRHEQNAIERDVAQSVDNVGERK